MKVGYELMFGEFFSMNHMEKIYFWKEYQGYRISFEEQGYLRYDLIYLQ